MSKGSFAFVLHGHLPYVLSHGRWPHGTDWLCEAAAETYLPIQKALRDLMAQGLEPKLTMGLSPVLTEQLADSSFWKEFNSYLNQKIEAAAADIAEFERLDQPQMQTNAQFWEKFYASTREHFEAIGRNIVGEFRRLQDEGILEIITCGATHGYYPLLSRDESLQVQTKMAVRAHERHFGRKPRGIWLPECAYRPRYEWTPPVSFDGDESPRLRKGTDEFLSENGLEFFIIDSALLRGGRSVGVYIDRFDALKTLWHRFERQYRPRAEDKNKTPREVYLVSSAPEGKKPVAVFTRDPDTGLLVWSGEHGYPGDGNYLDFHKKRFPGGHRYWAVTSSKSDLADKVEYVRQSALGRLEENSDHFVGKVEEILTDYNSSSGRSGLLVAPYDAELFGHWWFEGVDFLKASLEKFCRSDKVNLTFLSEDLDRRKPDSVISIPEGSWGEGNHHYIWLNNQNDWTWKHIYECEEIMCARAKQLQDRTEEGDGQLSEVVTQMGRELMLMSASDWQFLISTFAARDYAEMRLTEHFEDFKRLDAMAKKLVGGESLTEGEKHFFQQCSIRDSLFPDLDTSWFAAVEYPAD